MHGIGRQDAMLRKIHHRLFPRGHHWIPTGGTQKPPPFSSSQALSREPGATTLKLRYAPRGRLFAGALPRQAKERLPRRLKFGNVVGGENPGPGCPEQDFWLKCLTDDLKAVEATAGSTDDRRTTFEIESLWTTAARKERGTLWY